tara:strand:+ start:985 stop:1218 length:234 start_codon:yes stop_codon:yes gene_type:complete
MPQIGWFELLIIVVIAILVIGPKDFPVVLRKIGTWIGSVKRYFSEVQNDMTKLTDLEKEDSEENHLKNKEKKDEQQR